MWNPFRLATELKTTAVKAKKYRACLEPASGLLEECSKLLNEFEKTPGSTDPKDIKEKKKKCQDLKKQIDDALKKQGGERPKKELESDHGSR